MHVGEADPAGVDPDAHLPRPGLGRGSLVDPEFASTGPDGAAHTLHALSPFRRFARVCSFARPNPLTSSARILYWAAAGVNGIHPTFDTGRSCRRRAAIGAAREVAGRKRSPGLFGVPRVFGRF